MSLLPSLGKKITKQVATTARNDAAPVLGVNLERFALKGVNLVSDRASNFHRDALGGVGRKA
jgi:hypothetical protein